MLPVIHIELPSYTVCILIGVLAGFIVTVRRAHIYGIEKIQAAAGFILAVFGAAVGGRLFFVIQGLPDFLSSGNVTWDSFVYYVADAGQVFYGGMMGAVAFTYIAARVQLLPSFDLLDTLLPALPLGQAFGRIGCFMAGCCYGLPGNIGFYMPALQITVFPIQLVESAYTFVLFIVLMKMGRSRLPKGRMLGTYLVGYGAGRFVIEFFRGDAVRGFIGPLSVAQWVSIGSVAAGVWLLCFSYSSLSGNTNTRNARGQMRNNLPDNTRLIR